MWSHRSPRRTPSSGRTSRWCRRNRLRQDRSCWTSWLPGYGQRPPRVPRHQGAAAVRHRGTPPGKDGFPIHEIVGDVVASRHPRHDRGDRVVGWASGFDGLTEQVVADGDGLAPYDPALTPQHAVALQPLACVLYAVEQLPDLRGKHVAVIGQGSIGLLFSYSAKASGAAHVTGVDPIDRAAIGPAFGVDTVVRATSDRWVSHLGAADRADVVIEAVGHQVATLGRRHRGDRGGGTVFYFGVPDDDSYPISMRTMLRNNLTLKSGVTLERRRVLERANSFAREHRDLLPNYLTHTFGVDDVQAALIWPADRTGAASRSRSSSERVRGGAGGSAAPLRRVGRGPTAIGPEAFAQTGYDYVGFDCQHGYLDDADVALLLNRLEHVPIATAVRLPSAAPAPIGRMLDAGADAVVVAVSIRRAGSQGRRGQTLCAEGSRSFGPLRASLVILTDVLESRVGVFAMVETARGLDAVDDICAVPGFTGIYVGPADLAISLGYGLADAWTHRDVLDAMAHVHHRATAAGLVTGVHAGDGAIGATAARLGFQIITLASESQALRRGAAAHLAAAAGTDELPRNGGYQ